MALIRSTLGKLRNALSRSREVTGDTIRHLLIGKPLSKQLLADLERALIQADVGIKTAIELRKDIEAGWERGEVTDGNAAWESLKSQLIAYFPDEDRTLATAPPLEDGTPGGTKVPTVILVCGINGAGKTTSIAKLCFALREEGKTVLLAACDTFRAAAVEQLEVWSDRLGVQVIKGKQGGDPAAVAFDAAEAAVARNVDVLIVDTAGRLHTQGHLMDQLSKIQRVIQKRIASAPHEVLLVIDATTGQNGVNQAKVFSESVNVTGIFLTKLDGTARGGIVIAIREELDIPVKFVGLGETPQDVQPFEPERFVTAMFEGE